MIESKEFDRWNERKKSLQFSKSEKLFHEREIWWCSIGKNIGYEENGKHENFERPVLILKKYNRNLFLGVSMTSKAKDPRFHFEINNKSFVILSQVRTLSGKRLIRRIKKVTPDQFSAFEKEFRRLNL